MQDELAANVSLEQGKTLPDARGDVFRGLGAHAQASLKCYHRWSTARQAMPLGSSSSKTACLWLNVTQQLIVLVVRGRGGGVCLQPGSGSDGRLHRERVDRHGHLQHPAAPWGVCSTPYAPCAVCCYAILPWP